MSRVRDETRVKHEAWGHALTVSKKPCVSHAAPPLYDSAESLNIADPHEESGTNSAVLIGCLLLFTETFILVACLAQSLKDWDCLHYCYYWLRWSAARLQDFPGAKERNGRFIARIY